MKFVAIDFETANAERASICAVGIAIFQDGQLIDKKYYLLNPKTEFRELNIKIHGITPADVSEAPEFHQIDAELGLLLEDQVVVSHTEFDLQALDRTLERYELPSIKFHHADSCEVAREAWPQLRNHRLHTVAKHLSIPFTHHHALEDACVAGEIFIQGIQVADIPFESFIPKAKTRTRKTTQKKDLPQTPPAPSRDIKDRLVGLESSYSEPYPVQVDGESSFRSNLEKIAGYYDEDDGYNNDAHVAALYLENPEAVRVEINDLKVGYLTPAAAKALRKKLLELDAPEDPIMICGASIKGGHRINDYTVAQFGVRLDFRPKDLKLTRVRYKDEWIYPSGVKKPSVAPPATTTQSADPVLPNHPPETPLIVQTPSPARVVVSSTKKKGCGLFLLVPLLIPIAILAARIFIS